MQLQPAVSHGSRHDLKPPTATMRHSDGMFQLACMLQSVGLCLGESQQFAKLDIAGLGTAFSATHTHTPKDILSFSFFTMT